MNHGIIIHPEDIGELLRMEDKECGAIIKNMCRTFNGEEVERFDDRYLDFVSATLCGHLERDLNKAKAQSENGKRGGAPIGNANAKQAKNNPKTSQKQPKNKRKQTPNPNPSPNPNPNKKTYGECENVLLSDEEYQKVKDQGLEGLIEELSFYIAGTGKKYKSHYAVIRQWANRRKKENKVVPFSGDNAKNQFNRFTQRTEDIDYDRLIKN